MQEGRKWKVMPHKDYPIDKGNAKAKGLENGTEKEGPNEDSNGRDTEGC